MISTGRLADLLIEGRVATLGGAGGFGWREGLAIADGRVIAVGTPAQLAGLAGRGTGRWQLPADTVVLPGITDAHLHLMLLVLAERHVDLSAADGLAVTLELLRQAHAARAAAGDIDGWLLGHGWSPDRLGGWPDAELLETVCPGRPVALYAHDHHSRWLSQTALRLAGIGGSGSITSGVSERDDGTIRRDESGRPTGVLHEGACSLVDRSIPPPTEEQLEADLQTVARRLAALGVIGCHDPGELTDAPEIRRGPLFYGRLAAGGRLPLRVHASVRGPELGHAIELGLRSGDGVEAGSDDPESNRIAARYRMGWLKLFADGSLGSRSAALLEPYEDADEQPPTGSRQGMLLATAEELEDDLRRAAAAGITGQVHAIGDAGVRAALDALETQPATALRRRVEHAQLVHPADQKRFGSLGIAASVQPVHLLTDAPIARLAWGARSEHAFPLAPLDAGGALLPFGTDAPVEPVDPWPGLAAAVARRHPYRPEDEALGPAHAVALDRALRGACLDPPLSAEQYDLGRLVAGCRADLIVVPAAALGEPVDPSVLASTRPLAAMIDGELVYRAYSFDF